MAGNPQIGAGGRTRTDKGLPPQHFECCVSTNFTTPACRHIANRLSSAFALDAPLGLPARNATHNVAGGFIRVALGMLRRISQNYNSMN